MFLLSDRGVAKAWTWAHFGQGSGPILLDEVQCTGNELSLEECPHNVWELNNCDHMEDAGVSCNPYTGQSLEKKHYNSCILLRCSSINSFIN